MVRSESVNRFETTVSGELRQLAAAIGWRRSGQKEEAQHVALATSAPAAASKSIAATQSGRCRQIKLRQDGSRPTRFLGSPILEISDAEASARRTGNHRIGLYQRIDGKCFAQLVVEPPSPHFARPVYRVAEVEQASDLIDLVKACDPLDCLLVPVPGSKADDAGVLTALRHAKSQYMRLVSAMTPFLKHTA